MKCSNHPSVEAIAECAKCATALCGICADFSGSSVFCEKCSRDQENTAFVESQSKPRRDYDKILNEPVVEIRDPKKQRLEASIEKREKMYMAIVILGCVFLGFRLFTDIGSPHVLSAQEVQLEEISIERRTLCVQVFWEIAAVLQRGEEPDSSLRCEETPALNIITQAAGDIEVRHPNPQILGFSELYVSRNNPTPTAMVL